MAHRKKELMNGDVNEGGLRPSFLTRTIDLLLHVLLMVKNHKIF